MRLEKCILRNKDTLATRQYLSKDCMMFFITHSPECITKRKDPMTDFSGSD